MLGSYPLAGVAQGTYVNLPTAAAPTTTAYAPATSTLAYTLPSTLPTVYYMPTAVGQAPAQLTAINAAGSGFPGAGAATATTLPTGYPGGHPAMLTTAGGAPGMFAVRQAQLAPGTTYTTGNILTMPTYQDQGNTHADQLARAMQGLRFKDARGR